MPHENWRCAGLLAGSSVLAGAPPEDVDEHRPDIAPVFQMGEEDSTMAMQRYTLTTAGGARTADTWYDTTTDGDTAVITLPDAPAIWLIHRPHAQVYWQACGQRSCRWGDRAPIAGHVHPRLMGVTADRTIAPTHASKAVKASRRGSPSPDGQAHDARSTPGGPHGRRYGTQHPSSWARWKPSRPSTYDGGPREDTNAQDFTRFTARYSSQGKHP